MAILTRSQRQKWYRRNSPPVIRENEAPRTTSGSTWPDGKHPRHGGVTIFNKRPIEQQPRRPNDRQEPHR